MKLTRYFLCFLLLSIPYARAASAFPDQASPAFSAIGNFCAGGVVPQVRWPLAEQVAGLATWGSFCADDSATGRIESAKFLAPANLSLLVTGYVGTTGLRLALRNTETGEELDLRPRSTPGLGWQHNDFAVPPAWVGRPVQLIGEDRNTGFNGWFGFTAPLLPYSSVAIDTISTREEQSGFCPGGVDTKMQWQAGIQPDSVWGSYCHSGESGVGWMASQPVVAGGTLTFYLAGYPGTPGIRLSIENVATGRQLPVQLPLLFSGNPGETWRQYNIVLPSQWKGQSVRLLAEDKAVGPGGWIGFTQPQTTQDWRSAFVFGRQILGLVSLTLMVLLLPAVAVVMLAALQGVDNVVDLTALALLSLAFVGYIAFWIYFFSPIAGVVYTYLVLLCSGAVIAYALMTKTAGRLAPARRMLQPLLLLAFASVFVISVGCVYGKPDSIQDYAAERFGPPHLWIDNFLPKLLADGVYRGHIPMPLSDDWRSSDRPPLPSGMVLWMYPLSHGNRNLPYEVAAAILQLTSLAGLWGYLEAAQVNRKAAALALAATFFSGFVILNSFFTWPKLLPVAFLLLIPTYLFTERYRTIRNDWRVGAILGAAAAFAMLCHGGSAFGLFGLVCTALLLRRVPGKSFVLAAALTAMLLYMPWSLYQKYYDPPGDRLLKWHLAGVVPAHPKAKLSTLLIDNYASLHARGILDYKLRNLSWLFKGGRAMWKHSRTIAESLFTGDQALRNAAVASIRHSMFVHWFLSIDLFTFTPLALLLLFLLRRKSSPEFQQAWRLWLATALTLVVWCLLMFGPATTLVHQGCYFTEIAAFAAGVLALWALSPTLTVVFTAFHVAFNLAVYIWLHPQEPPGFDTFMGPLNPVLTWASILSALGFGYILYRVFREASGPNIGSTADAMTIPRMQVTR